MQIYILPILIIIGCNILVSKICGKKYGASFPMTMFSICFIMFFGQMIFGTYSIGVMIIIFLSLMGIVVCTVKKEWLKLTASTGFISFILLAITFVIIDYHRPLVDFDEFWHWGMMIKESLRLDSFYAVAESRQLIHKDYPPFLCMLEVFWLKIAGGFHEDAATIALHIFSYGIFTIPLSEKIVLKISGEGKYNEQTNNSGDNPHGLNIKSVLILLLLVQSLVMLVINALDYACVARTLLADMPMTLIFGYMILVILDGDVFEDWFGAISFSVASATLVMIKQIGFLLLMSTLLLLFAITIADNKKIKKFIIIVITVLCTSVTSSLIWKMYVVRMNVSDVRSIEGGNGQFSLNKISIKDYIDVVFIKKQGFLRDVFLDFNRSLFTRNIANIGWLDVTCITAIIFVSFLIILIHVIFKEKFSLSKAVSVGISSLLTMIGYAFVLSIVFLFCMTTDEMQELRGFERYWDGLFIGLILALISYMLLCMAKKYIAQINKFNIFFSLCLMAMCVFANTSSLIYLAPSRLNINKYQAYINNGHIISEAPSNSTIGFVFDKDKNAKWYIQGIYTYLLNEYNLTWDENLFSLEMNADNEQKILKYFDACDYIFIINTNDNVQEIFNKYLHCDSNEGDLIAIK